MARFGDNAARTVPRPFGAAARVAVDDRTIASVRAAWDRVLGHDVQTGKKRPATVEAYRFGLDAFEKWTDAEGVVQLDELTDAHASTFAAETVPVSSAL